MFRYSSRSECLGTGNGSEWLGTGNGSECLGTGSGSEWLGSGSECKGKQVNMWETVVSFQF